MKKIALYNPYLQTKGGGEKVCLALAESLHTDLNCEVHLITNKPVDLDDLASYFKLDLKNIHVDIVDLDTTFYKILSRFPLPGRIRNIFFDYKVLRVVRSNNFDVFINNCYQSNLPSPTKNGVYMCMFPQRIHGFNADVSLIKRLYIRTANLLNRIILHPRYRSPTDTYRIITANSAYTQGYIQKLWHKESQILYPICENMYDSTIPKEKIILHVGRFFANEGASHHKRQDSLLEAFSQLHKLHDDGWELHFAGSVAEDAGALKYILQLMKDAKNLPVFFHFNCQFSELHKLYNQASIYWHATGYGSDPEKHPEKQEHFGISTVEAMSAGAIPIVINSAGQKESVVQNKNGYLWNSLDELKEHTTEIAQATPNALTSYRKTAKKTATKFDDSAFRKNVLSIFSAIVK